MSGNRGGSINSSSKAMCLYDENEDSWVDGHTGVAGYDMETGQGSDDCYGCPDTFGVHSFGSIEGATPTPGMLTERDNPKSIFVDPKQMWGIRKKYSIPSRYALHAPGGHLRANFHAPGWVCMYQAPFDQGLRLPLPHLIVEFCHYHGISPGQLTPNAWRVLLSLQVLSEFHKIDISIADIKSNYDFMRVPKEDGRYMLPTKRGIEPLITNIGDGERRWKQKYFFIEYDALGVPDGKHIPSAWSRACEC